MYVSQFINAKGNPVKQHFIITDSENGKGKIAFQSYDSVICEIVSDPGMGFDKLVRFGKDWNYSNTTTHNRNDFMNQIGLVCLNSSKAIETAIKTGYAKDQAVAVMLDTTL